MNGVISYILAVTAAAILAAVLQSLAGQGTMAALIRFLCGVFMALTILSPLQKLELPDFDQWLSGIQYDGRDAAAAGADMAEDASSAIIKSRVEAYILDKATLYGAALEVDVELDPSGIPVAVTLKGNVAPGAKVQLSNALKMDLGLDEEAQHWIS